MNTHFLVNKRTWHKANGKGIKIEFFYVSAGFVYFRKNFVAFI